MDAKQRILTALGNAEPDRVPICDWIDEPMVIDLARFLGLDTGNAGQPQKVLSGEESVASLDLLCLVMKRLGIEATWFPYSTGLAPIDDNHARDKYDRVFHISGHGMPLVAEGAIATPADIAGYDMASRLEPDDLAGINHLIETMGEDGVVFLDVTDPFHESCMVRGGMEKLLMDYILNPGLVHDVARIVTDYKLAVIDMAAGFGVEFIVMGGDLAGEQTLLMSPAHYREFVKPYQQELVDHAHRQGLKIVKHSDGNVWPILDDFVEVGFDGFNPVQPQCMEIAEVKQRLAGKMCIIGNIDCRHLLPYGPPEEVEETVKRTIAVAAPGGGYILSSSNSLHPECKPENIVAMVEATHRYGVYGDVEYSR